jgi:hypothetical protein
VSLRVARKWLSGTHSSNTNGPVPIGWVVSPDRTCAGAITYPACSATVGITDQGVNVIETVMGRWWRRSASREPLGRQRARRGGLEEHGEGLGIEHLAVVEGDPGPQLERHTVKSALGVIDFARYGCQWPSRSITTRDRAPTGRSGSRVRTTGS